MDEDQKTGKLIRVCEKKKRSRDNEGRSKGTNIGKDRRRFHRQHAGNIKTYIQLIKMIQKGQDSPVICDIR